jgi:hypothetical protein
MTARLSRPAAGGEDAASVPGSISASAYGAFLVAASALVLLGAVALAVRGSRGADMILGGASAPVEGWLDLGTVLRTFGAHRDVIRFPLVLVTLCVLALRWRSEIHPSYSNLVSTGSRPVSSDAFDAAV